MAVPQTVRQKVAVTLWFQRFMGMSPKMSYSTEDSLFWSAADEVAEQNRKAK